MQKKICYNCFKEYTEQSDRCPYCGYQSGQNRDNYPFALPEGVRVYLDESLRAFDPVYPAAGAPNNAVELHLDELERVTGGQWVDVCKAG